jgi:tripartite-type tricarboxylate transporter receptor subunit TctC
MKKVLIQSLLLVMCLVLVLPLFSEGAQEESEGPSWPERPVTVIVPYSAGGGTDAVARVVAEELQKEYQVPFNVVNRTGGSGVIGHTAIANAKPDGYTIGLATFSSTTFKWFGSSNVTYEDYTPIALFNIDSTAILVNSNSKYTSLNQLLDDIKNNPGQIKMATPIGAGHHLAFSNLLDQLGIDPNNLNVIPVAGGAIILQELAAGGVDVGPSTLPEAAGMIEGGKVRPLAVMSSERNSSYPDLPTAEEETGLEIQGGTWRGLVGPKGMPKEVTQKLMNSMERIYNEPKFQEALSSRGYGLSYLEGEDFYDFMKDMFEANGRILKKLDLIE